MRTFRAQMKKISIIMPNYCHSRFLRERLDSIFAQDYPEKEVILLDDASTDGSLTILREYVDRPETVCLLENKTNSGNTFLQWQKGLEHATGDYVWIAESDDAASPTFLSRMVAALEQTHATLAFCHSQWVDEDNQPIERSRDTRWNRDFSMVGEQFVRQYLLGYNTICNASAVLFRRDALSAIDWNQLMPFTASGDRLFWIYLAMQGRVAYVADSLNRFRQHTNKVSGSAENKGLNIIQDHAIYRLIAPSLALTSHEKHIICGYHWKAIMRTTVSEKGKTEATKIWSEEPEFGRLSYLLYLLHRAQEKC